MKHDFPDYIPDMDHDGEITGKDSALFHEMLDEDQEEVRNSGGSTRYGGGSWSIVDSVVKWGLILICGGYLALLVKGVFPINVLTALLALFCIGGILGLLNL